MKRMTCQICGAVFFGTSIARFCKKCRAERQREAVRNWAQEHKDTMREYNRQKQQKYYLLHREEILSKRKRDLSKGKATAAQETPKAPAFVSVCRNFRPDVVACVLCAGNCEEKFRACFNEVTK